MGMGFFLLAEYVSQLRSGIITPLSLDRAKKIPAVQSPNWGRAFCDYLALREREFGLHFSSFGQSLDNKSLGLGVYMHASPASEAGTVHANTGNKMDVHRMKD